MKQAYRVIVGACQFVAGHPGAWIVGLALVLMASLPRPAWGQSAWPSYPNNNAITIFSNGDTNFLGGTFFKAQIVDLNGSGMIVDSLSMGSRLQGWDTANNGTARNVLINPSGGNVGIGTLYPQPQFLLAVNGTIGAKDVIVTNSGWSDYVFQSGYRLLPLSEVSTYIQQHHHLPDIPSEAEVKEKGVSVGEMQAKLLAKVEELTLHMIQQERENKELRGRLAQLETRAASGSAPASVR